MTELIRLARPDDFEAILGLIEAAFDQPDEAGLFNALVNAGSVDLSLVAEGDNGLVGHVSYISLDGTCPDRVSGLLPISVHPGHQRRGIGARLIAEGDSTLPDMGVEHVAVLGDTAYYTRFGFSADHAARCFTGPYDGPNFMAKSYRSREVPCQPWQLFYPEPLG